MRPQGLPGAAASTPVAWLGLVALAALLGITACGRTDSIRDGSAGRIACPSCNLVLISLDTLRADHVGAYGYPHDTTPCIDRWAEGAIVFERAYATSPKTAESHMSVFTGLYPAVHRVFSVADPEGAPLAEIRRLSNRISTLPAVLKKQGYHTVGFHGGGNVSAKFGFDRGFDLYEWGDLAEDPGKESIFRFLASRATRPDEKLFLLVHSYHVHDPYTPGSTPDRISDYRGRIEHDLAKLTKMAESEPCGSVAQCFWSRVDTSSEGDALHLETLYDAEIRELDARVGELLQQLTGLPGETVVVLIGDHGEEFGEHGDFKHRQLYDEILQVPLVIGHPHLREGVRIRTRVSLIDLLPTLLEMLEIEAELPVQGSSLLPLLADDEEAREIYSEYPPFRLRTLIAGEKKLLVQDREARDMDGFRKLELYDLREDPGERRNLADSDPDLQQLLDRLVERSRENRSLGKAIERSDPPATETLDAQTIEQLEALGYL